MINDINPTYPTMMAATGEGQATTRRGGGEGFGGAQGGGGSGGGREVEAEEEGRQAQEKEVWQQRSIGALN